MKLSLKNVRLAFPVLFTAKADKNGNMKFSAALLFAPDHPAHKMIKAAEQEVGKAKWGAKWPGIEKQIATKDRMALHDGDAKEQYDGYTGNYFVNASNKVRPLTLDRDKSVLNEEDGRVYAGCFVNASIELWAQDNTHGKAINCSLRGIQFASDGDAFAAGGAASEDEFDEVEGEEELV